MTLVQELEKLAAKYGEDIPREDIMRLIDEYCDDCDDEVCLSERKEIGK